MIHRLELHAALQSNWATLSLRDRLRRTGRCRVTGVHPCVLTEHTLSATPTGAPVCSTVTHRAPCRSSALPADPSRIPGPCSWRLQTDVVRHHLQGCADALHIECLATRATHRHIPLHHQTNGRESRPKRGLSRSAFRVAGRLARQPSIAAKQGSHLCSKTLCTVGNCPSPLAHRGPRPFVLEGCKSAPTVNDPNQPRHADWNHSGKRSTRLLLSREHGRRAHAVTSRVTRDSPCHPRMRAADWPPAAPDLDDASSRGRQVVQEPSAPTSRDDHRLLEFFCRIAPPPGCRSAQSYAIGARCPALSGSAGLRRIQPGACSRLCPPHPRSNTQTRTV